MHEGGALEGGRELWGGGRWGRGQEGSGMGMVLSLGMRKRRSEQEKGWREGERSRMKGMEDLDAGRRKKGLECL